MFGYRLINRLIKGRQLENLWVSIAYSKLINSRHARQINRVVESFNRSQIGSIRKHHAREDIEPR